MVSERDGSYSAFQNGNAINLGRIRMPHRASIIGSTQGNGVMVIALLAYIYHVLQPLHVSVLNALKAYIREK